MNKRHINVNAIQLRSGSRCSTSMNRGPWDAARAAGEDQGGSANGQRRPTMIPMSVQVPAGVAAAIAMAALGTY